MSIAGLELNDAGVVLAVDGRVLAESPGYALADADGLWLGERARARARLSPRLVNRAFWERLGLEELARPVAHARTHADLAALHLEHVWAQRGEGVEGLVVAVPGSFSRDQLGLLLGVSEQIELPVRGLVDCALAALAEDDGAGAVVVHVEARLHGADVTVLERAPAPRIAARSAIDGFSLTELCDALAKVLAAQFVRETRFDPRHSAPSEQALYSGLPGWLGALVENPATVVELGSSGGRRHRIELARAELAGVLEPAFVALAEQVRAGIPRGAPVRVGHHLARLPFAAETLSKVLEVPVEALVRGAGALGAARHADAIARAGGPRSLTRSLVPRPPERPLATVPAAPPRRPTHIVHAGLAHRIRGPSFAIGHAGDELLVGDAAVAARCVLHERGGVTVLEPLGAVVLNGRTVEGDQPIAAGDRIGFDDSDLELLLVALSDGPQA